MGMKIMLNRFDNPKPSEEFYVGDGDKVFAGYGAEDFGFTVGKEYEIIGISPTGYLLMVNDEGESDDYSVEYFHQYSPRL